MMKKEERKSAYRNILSLMLQLEHEKAFEQLCVMCGKDAGLFVFVDYKKSIEELKKRRGEL
jgi:hypothetical protein